MKENAQFIEKHSMFRRLSGQVVWGLLEENDASQEECGTFMDIFYARFQHTVAILARTESRPTGFIRITTSEAHRKSCALSTNTKPCTQCDALAGAVFPAGLAGLIGVLPPYSIGCTLGLEFLATAPEDAVIQTELPPSPQYQLCCPRRPLSRIILAMRENEPLF